MHSVADWFRSSGLMPHGFCYQWKAGLIGLHAISDTLIALAYFSIPIALIHFVRKRQDLPFSWMFVCFGVFIAACGLTHTIEVVTLWVPWYWLSGGIKVVTAVASLPTAIFLARLVPKALSLPSHDQLRLVNEELLRRDAILQQSEEQFRRMAENIQEIFWTLDPHTKAVTYVSPAFAPICERSVASLYAQPTSYREIIHPEDRDIVLAALDSLVHTDRLDQEFRIICPGGAVKWLRVIGSTVRGPNGEVLTLVGATHEITRRKSIEAALREREDFFRDLVEHCSDLICTHTLDGRFLSVNEMSAQILGYTREELLAKPMRDFFPEDLQPDFDEYLRSVQRDGSAKGFMVVLTKGGHRRIWEYHNTLRTDGVSTPIVRGIAHDVTEQKQAEKALRLSEEKFSKAFLASPYALVISSIDEGRLIEVNDSFERISGYSRKESIGRTTLELKLWASPAHREEIVKEITEAGRVRSKQITYQNKSGTPLIVNFSAEVIEVAGQRLLLSVHEDISERKRAEWKLLEYEKVVEGVEEMIAVIDNQYRYLLANRTFASYRRLPLQQIIGHSVSDVLNPDFFECVIKQKLDEALTGKIVQYEVIYAYPEIGLRNIFVSYFPIYGPLGVDRVVCVLQDITERKRADEELQRLSGELLRLQDVERRKIARDLHDSTGQDLVALATTIAQLRACIPSNRRKCRKLAAGCRAIADRCLREVRTLSYILHPPMLDEAGLEDAICDFTEGFAQRTGIKVDLSLATGIGRLPQDLELALFRVVQESLTNVQRHSGSHTARISLNRRDGSISLEIIDSGRGISASPTPLNGELPRRLGVGILSMQERMKQVSGELEIVSSAAGTTVRALVPAHA